MRVEPGWDEEDAPPRRGRLRWVAWVVIGALLLGPVLTLRQLYQVEPLMVLLLAGVVGGVAYLAHARRGDALARIEKLFDKRSG